MTPDRRTPVQNNHYLVVTTVWYATVIAFGSLASWIIWHFHGSSVNTLILVTEIIGAFVAITGLAAPASVGLVLRKMNDPAAAMTASALVMLGHIMVLSGPLYLATPLVSRYLAVKRYNSGGF